MPKIATTTTKETRNPLSSAPYSILNHPKLANDANVENAVTAPAKNPKKAAAGPNLFTATPPSFLKDIILPDEDEVTPPPTSLKRVLIVVRNGNVRRLQRHSS